MTAVRKRSWKPQLRGDIYCSPACGLGCRKAWYDRAVKAADALVAALGQGWTRRVWENLGWHACAYWAADPENPGDGTNTGLRIHVDLNSPPSLRYTAFIGGDGQTGSGRTPKAALRKALAIEQRRLEAIAARVQQAQQTLKRKKKSKR